MAKKNRDEYVDKLERELKEAKSLNRQLLRRIKKLDRNFKAAEELTSQEREEDEKEVRKDEARKASRCPKCHEGNMTEIKIMDRSLFKCSQCDYRTKAQREKA